MKEETESTSSTQTSWYALKVFFNRVAEVSNRLSDVGVEVFVPMESKAVVDADGKRNFVRQPLVNSLMFFRGNNEDVAYVSREFFGKAMVYHRPGEPRNAAPIPDSEMEMFRLVTDNLDVPLKYLGADTEKYTVGEQVRVTGGPLEGAVGHICRVRGDKRLVVSIAGVCAVATSYIPASLLAKL